MKSLGKVLMIMVLGLGLTGCPPCTPVYWDYGTLPAEALELVPYQDGMNYSFMHSAGQSLVQQQFWYTENRDVKWGILPDT